MALHAHTSNAESLVIHAEMRAEWQSIFTPQAMGFVAELVQRFQERREALLVARQERQQRIAAGEMPDFRADTVSIRTSEWTVAPIPPALQDRRVEITGPAEPKMIINALNSGAKVFMADLEDALCPSWERVAEGQKALFDAARHSLQWQSPEGKTYTLNESIATLIVRPRGWHLPEKHITQNGQPVSGALVDFGLFFFHNAVHMAAQGTGPFFYLPKIESMEEAQLWADVFAYAEERLGLTHGTIKATVLIETILAAFEMDEILYALRDYCCGLNCGRWDYIFSFIKKFHMRPDFVLPERAQVTMKTPFLTAYYLLLIKTCHRRGAFAMGGMAAQIPVKDDAAANEKAFAAVRADKEREASAGHDGTWVAHPALVPVALEVFNHFMPHSNQVSKQRADVTVSAVDLLAIPSGTITHAGLRNNINVALQYLAAWLSGFGAVPIHHLMEDAATAEISRSQLWQWVYHGASLESGEIITHAMIADVLEEELSVVLPQEGSAYFAEGSFAKAAKLLRELVEDTQFKPFLTEPAYALLA
ncbi:MAG: malate synthase A [Rickettsiales bacterium]|nr:malate synthase A [Rickettsiales bacterium]